MAFVIKDAFVEIDGADLSCHVASVEVNLSKAEVEVNTMCGQGTIAGMEESSITVTFLQSFAVGEVDDTLYPLWDDEEEFVVNIRPHGGNPNIVAPVAADNPQYSATCRVLDYTALAGGVGDRSETDVEFKVQGAITRATA